MSTLNAAATEATSESTSPDAQPLSKNAMKKLAKAARMAEQKKERRAYEKEKKKEKKRQLVEKRAAGELDEDEDVERRKKRARTEGPKRPFQARIVVDLGFDDMMTENEVKSLTSQLAYTYSANRKASQRFSTILFTSLNGKTYTRLESLSQAAYKRWHDTEWWSESYERLWTAGADSSTDDGVKDKAVIAAGTGSSDDTPATNDSTTGVATDAAVNKTMTGKLSTNPQRTLQENVVYLTADSPEELAELKEGDTYIIGGICDHNRYKNLCFNRSKDSKIRSAKLPIGTYLAELRTRKVLTVNQTFEILLKWVETKDWRQAFEAVVPKRKFKDTTDSDAGVGVGTAEDTVGAEADGTVVVDASAVEGNEVFGEEDYDRNIETDGTGESTVVTPLLGTGGPLSSGTLVSLDHDVRVEVTTQSQS